MLVWARYGVQMVAMIAWLGPSMRLDMLRTKRLPLQLVRSIVLLRRCRDLGHGRHRRQRTSHRVARAPACAQARARSGDRAMNVARFVLSGKLRSLIDIKFNVQGV